MLCYSQESITFNRSLASSNISSGVTVTSFMSKVTSSSYAMLRILKGDLFQHLHVPILREKFGEFKVSKGRGGRV